MGWFEPGPLSPKQIERRKKIWTKGRSRFILYRGILGWGLLMVFETILFRWHNSSGWHLPPTPEIYFDIAVALLIWPVAGYYFGAALWKKMIEAPVLEDQNPSTKAAKT